VAYLREEIPADQQGLLTDLFEKIVFYDDRAKHASAHQLANGKYEVTLDWQARKIQVDGQGNETSRTLDDWMDIGVFARKPGDAEAKERVLYLKKHHIAGTSGSVTVVVDGKPYDAGIDPYNKLIDRVSDDNRTKVEVR